MHSRHAYFAREMGKWVLERDRESVQWPYQVRDTFIYLYLQPSVRVSLRTKRIPAPNNRISIFFFSTRTNARRKAFNSVPLLFRDFIVRQSTPNLMFSDSLIHFHRCRRCTSERLEATTKKSNK